MSNKKTTKNFSHETSKFYSLENIKKTGATYNVIFGERSNGKTYSVEEAKESALEAAKILKISDDILEKSPFNLSGGQMRKVAIAGILAYNPDILLLDEPTSQLDPIGAERFLHTLKRINKNFGVTILLSEQCLEEVLPIVDRVFLLQDGELAEVKNIRETGKVFYEKKLFCCYFF